MFQLHSPHKPTGDQPLAIKKLVAHIRGGAKHQVLLGVTGSGKTFTVSNVIAQINKPTLIISHNKTLAAQLYQEYRDFFPDNAVSYFVSYYDYYQPEAYIPQTDTYIEKETDINEIIDKLRLQATTNLLTRKDVIVVASVSCIYNLGAPSEYERNIVKLNIGDVMNRTEVFGKLIALQYSRTDREFARGTFRVRGDVIDAWPAYEDNALRISLDGEKIIAIDWIDPLSSAPITCPQHQQPARQLLRCQAIAGGAGLRGGRANYQLPITSIVIYPAKHYLTDPSQYKGVFETIKTDLNIQVKKLEQSGRLLEAHRLSQRVNYDLDMIQEVGYVNGIENYSRYFDNRAIGEAPHSLLDYFHACDPDFLTIVDESHMTIPQIRGMYNGDQARKQTLIDYGFRLPAALDNRPLKFDEFSARVPQTIYTSATPDEWEMKESKGNIVEQLIRPTGLIDPEIDVRDVERQVPDLVVEIMKRKQKGERVLVTTLTKKTAEDLAEYLNDEKKITSIISNFKLKIENFPKVTYLHSDIKTLDRQDILDQLRNGEVDVLIGINLLREGLDLPEVSLVAILDADQEGFLRSRSALIQTMGRAARHINGKVILYAHSVTKSMKAAMGEVSRRRSVQIAYNLEHNITPRGIIKPIRKKLVDRLPEEAMSTTLPKTIAKKYRAETLDKLELASLTPEDKKALIRHLNKQMFAAADKLDFERAAGIRDRVLKIKEM